MARAGAKLEDGPTELYEQLGFVKRHLLCSRLLKLDGYAED